MATPSGNEALLIRRLQDGDDGAFRQVVTQYHAVMIRLAETFVPSRAIAEEVVQDTWIAVIRGIKNFEGRSSLKTWIFRILANQARDRGVRESRSTPVSSLSSELDESELSVPIERFVGPDGRGTWAQPLSRWSEIPEERLAVGETLRALGRTIETLPENQRRVLVLRDVEGWTSDEVRELMDISEINQRVLLHRARSKIRSRLDVEAHLLGSGQ